jgi:uncharacterized protein (DUF2225 family)
MGLLSGLSALGLGNLEKTDDIYKNQEEKKVVRQQNVVEQKAPEEQDFTFDKTYECPVCGKKFKTRTMKSGKAKLIGTDMDLRPKYELIDTLKYDVIACPHCGYAALTRYFQYVGGIQKKAIVTKICAAYKPQPIEEKEVYTYEEALEQYKLALANAIVKNAKPSEKAFICLKSGWLLRGQAESLHEGDAGYAEKKKELEDGENEYLENALDGFIAARQSEGFPMCGMDESTVDYLIAVLAMRFGRYETTSKLVSSILTSRAANPRMKDKARELKEVLMTKLQG